MARLIPAHSENLSPTVEEGRRVLDQWRGVSKPISTGYWKSRIPPCVRGCKNDTWKGMWWSLEFWIFEVNSDSIMRNDNAKTKIESTESDRKIWIFRKEFEIVVMQEGFELFESRKWITSGKDRWNVNQCRIKNDMFFVTYTKFEGLTYRMMHITSTRYSF